MSIRERIKTIKHLQNKYFICVLEHPADAVNIASTIRNISAFGVEKLYVVGGNNIVKDFETSRSNKKLTQLSVGSNKWVFVKHFETAEECINHLKKNLYTIAVTSSHQKGRKNVRLYDENFTQKRLAVWFGSESNGISQYATENSEMCIQIPMGGIVESLNLGTSTGIVLSYISYQRLKFVFDRKKATFKSKSLKHKKMKSWDDFFPVRS